MMKKSILLSLLGLPMIAMAQVSTPPAGVEFKTGMFGIKMSPNGEWIASQAGDASVYNVKTGETFTYEGHFLGDSRAISNNGIAVGNTESFNLLIMYNGKVYMPVPLILLGGGTINSISADGTVITGYRANPNGNDEELSQIPFIAYINDLEAEDIEVVDLDYPKKDFFGGPPAYVLGFSISEDGKTMVGQVTDFRGMYTYPIVYKEESHGVWSYTLPSESLFNPTDIYIPLNPEFNEPVFPEPEDFMSPVNRKAYEQAYEQFSQGYGEKPDPYIYMDENQKIEYDEALAFYLLWAENNSEAVKEYFQLYAQVLKTSPSFGHNQSVVSPDGSFFAVPGGDEGSEEVGGNVLYIFQTDGSGYITRPLPGVGYFPNGVIGDGSITLTCPPDRMPSTYLLPAGGYDYKTMDQVLSDYPDVLNWINSNFLGNGQVTFSSDMSVVSGALTYYLLPQLTDEMYYTYILTNMQLTGIKEVAADASFDGIYRVYNLQGHKMLETKDISGLKNLPKGIYIVNGKKVVL